MKKILFLFFAFITLSAKAQKAEMVGNAMCYTEVVGFDGLAQNDIFVKALVALSEYEGVNANSSSKIDVCDKESGTIVYKGKVYNGFYKQNFMAGWHVYVDYILIIECKDGKARFRFMAPTLTYCWTAETSGPHTFPINQIYPTYTAETDYKIEKASKQLAQYLPACCETFVKAVIDLTKSYSSDF